MNINPRILLVIPLLISLLAIAGCGSGTESPLASSPAAKLETAAPQAVRESSPAPAVLPEASSFPSFMYYNKVKLGMSKDEVDRALGIPSTCLGEESDGYYTYSDPQGYGVIVIFNQSKKAFSKAVLGNNPDHSLAIRSQKPVTREQCDKIAKGTSYADVVKLLGGEGVECLASTKKNDINQMDGWLYRWGNPDGSFIEVIIQGDGTVFSAAFRE